MLHSVDLFSGIGGIAWALRGLARPVLYCEIAQDCQDVLRNHMKKGKLPTAPICHDVNRLDRKWIAATHGNKPIDLITAGFPCIGFSNFGKRQGYDNAQSSLFSEVVRLTDQLKPPMVFMENVPSILNMGMDAVVDEFTQRGYDLRWCVRSGAEMGAPHERARWFCLAIQKGFELGMFEVQGGFRKFEWKNEPARMTLESTRANRLRCGALGNAVVPDAVRYAFLYLLSGAQPVTTLSPLELFLFPVDTHQPYEREAGNYPKYGALLADDPTTVYLLPKPPVSKQGKVDLIFDPAVFIDEEKQANSRHTSDLITEPVHKGLWSTPRHGMTGTCNILSERSIRDLPTQIRFERSTPDALRHGQMAPEFVEWLMGYPSGWTQRPRLLERSAATTEAPSSSTASASEPPPQQTVQKRRRNFNSVVRRSRKTKADAAKAAEAAVEDASAVEELPSSATVSDDSDSNQNYDDGESSSSNSSSNTAESAAEAEDDAQQLYSDEQLSTEALSRSESSNSLAAADDPIECDATPQPSPPPSSLEVTVEPSTAVTAAAASVDSTPVPPAPDPETKTRTRREGGRKRTQKDA
jgi:hypothetical protein